MTDHSDNKLLIQVKKHYRAPLSLAVLLLQAQFCMAKVCTHRITKFSTFLVRLKINVTGESSRAFGESTGPKVGSPYYLLP
jgi:hypothetical protein